MQTRATIALIAVLLWSGATLAAPPAMRVIRGSESMVALLTNGGFDEALSGQLAAWSAAPQGYSLRPGEGRNGSRSLRCENTSVQDWTGASQTLRLDRAEVAPILVRGWSKADNVTGSTDNDYSLYVDIVYSDGTTLWGQTANFRTGTHDWEAREMVILPEKPIQSLTLYCLLRGHLGRAWFDDIEIQEVKAGQGAMLFQGAPVLTPARSAKSTGPTSMVRSGDGLRIRLRDGAIASVRVDGQELAAGTPSGFLARDAAVNSDVFGFESGKCPELGLKLETHWQGAANHIRVQGRLLNTRKGDRAVTLVFSLPVDAAGWRWGDDIRRSRAIGGKEEFANLVSIRCGATGAMSLYPLAAISGDWTGLGLALDCGQPAVFRLGYHAGAKQFYLAYDFGLVPETQRFPNGADFSFVLFRFDSRWGFRAAFQKFEDIFPDYFRVRSRDQGTWMPFTDIGTVPGWQDFGFRYHEGSSNLRWDRDHGILSFRYTEPMTWWMPMPKNAPRTVAEAIKHREELARSGHGTDRDMAQVSRFASMWDESGEPCLLFRNEPWCQGAVWSLAPNPRLAGPSPVHGAATNAATIYWNDAIKQQLYGPQAKGRPAGEYLDSLEGYVTAELNFRRDHFHKTRVPLSFATDTKRPALFKGLAAYEFTRWLSEDVHRMGKLMFANSLPNRFTFLCPWLDVMGTETDWLSRGKYHPAQDPQMSLWRTMSAGKPYLLLMNTDYDTFTPDLVELYFQRCLFYGIWPGMFSHNAADNPYWQNPKWYNRDRPLFKKYLPLVKRVAEAGWQPVTLATSENPHIWVERFGPGAGGTNYFTLFNDTTTLQTSIVRIDVAALRTPATPEAMELLSSSAVTNAGLWLVGIEPQRVKLLALPSVPPRNQRASK